MLANRLVQLIEKQSESMTEEALHNVLTNEGTVSFRRVPRAELKAGVASLYPPGDPLQRNRLGSGAHQEAPAEVYPRARTVGIL